MDSAVSFSSWIQLIHNPDVEGIAQQGKDKNVCVCVFSYYIPSPNKRSFAEDSLKTDLKGI